MKISEPLQQQLWSETELPSMSSAAAFRVMTLAPQERELALMVRDQDYGLNTLDLLARYDRASSSWRTSQASLVQGLDEFSETYPNWGMMRNGTIYRLPMLGPGIDGQEFGFLPTPTRSADSKGSPRGRYFGSGTCYRNLREVLRDGPDDPIYPNPEFVEGMMGFPPLWTDLKPSETQ